MFRYYEKYYKIIYSYYKKEKESGEGLKEENQVSQIDRSRSQNICQYTFDITEFKILDLKNL